MRCSKCGSDNPTGKTFCGDCGAPLVNHCPKCGADNPLGKRFCGDCGTALVPKNLIQSAAFSLNTSNVAMSVEQTAGLADGERKTVTALFADIKGSTELMAELDPEEARSIVDPALKLMIEAVRRYDGYIVQSTGDGIFALFGAPIAHEDHPQRALYAALRMQEELRRYSARIVAEGASPIQCRVGAHTGEVVVRSITTGEAHTEYTPIGYTTNLASRMQAVAPVGSIAVSDTMRRWCEGYFAFRSLGLTRLRGVTDPIEVHEVTGLGPLRTRLQRAVGRGLTRFVGRERELESMRHAAELARSGHGQIVAAVGDPGIGKSRLLYEFKVTSHTGWKVLDAVSISHGKASAYLPVIDLLRNFFEILPEDGERKRREKIAGRIAILDRSLEDTLPYIYRLLGIVEGDDPLDQADGQVRKRRTLEAIKRILLRESLNQPLMIIFEDLHWMDMESEATLNVLADAVATARILLLVNYRPEYRHEWINKAYYTQVRLEPLGRETAEQMVSAVIGDQPELVPVRRLIIERTEGNPFFIEEIVQDLFEQGVLARNGSVKLMKSLREVKVPATVQGVLASRIDRLAPAEKELLQTLSVIGREFSLSLVERVAVAPGTELSRGLAALQAAEFIYEQPAVSDTEFTFKHALTLEVAYNSILLERRKQIHERTAQAIESLYEANLADHYADLARHYVRGHSVLKAIKYLHLVGEQATSRSAYLEASANVTAALELLRTQPESIERDRTEIGLVLTLAMGMGLGDAKGFENSLNMLERARQLSKAIDDEPNRLKILEFLAIHYGLHPNYVRRSRILTTELLTLGENMQDAEMVGWSRYWLGWLSMHEGDFAAAMQELEQAHQLSCVASAAQPVRPMDWRVHSRAFTSFVLWVSGYPSRAVSRIGEAFVVARELAASANDRLFAWWWSGYLHLLLRDSASAARLTDQAIALVREQLPAFVTTCIPLDSWALVQLGHVDAGLSQMLQLRSNKKQDTGTLFFETWEFLALGNAYLGTGRASEGVAAMDEGLELCQSSGVRLLESEIHRLKGELLLNNGNHEAAAQCFRDAIELAHQQGAKSWELRATMSLARLLEKQGRRDEARSMLSEIYSWFTEGFDTADLKDAKVLVDELS
jgi:class 3 adenylate cyclase/tetratricopeptide (TPR) repeat protein